jgi:hypothetical protein
VPLTPVTVAAGTASPYVGTGLPAFPSGFNPMITDVGPSAASRPRLPGGKVTRTVTAASIDELSRSLQSAVPGTVIELLDGQYEGELDITAAGSVSAPIVIRPRRPLGAVFVGKTKLRLNGSYVTLDGLKFSKTGAQTIEVAGLGNRVANGVFEECGDGQSGATTGLIMLDNKAANGDDQFGLNRPRVERRATFDGNIFVRPRNTVFWQNHGLVGNSYIGNRIQGPHGIAEGETEAIKIGFGFGAEDTNTTIAYNEITAWEGWPYVIGIKSSSVTLTGNVIGSGRLEVRYGDRVTLKRNVIVNGDLMLSGSGHEVTGNVVVNSASRDNLGPFVVAATAVFQSDGGSFDGQQLPYYYRALTNSTVSDNTFVSLDPSDAGTAFMLGLNENVWSLPPKGNSFTRNLFFRNSGPTSFLAAAGTPTPPAGLFVSANTWTSNVFMCGAQCGRSDIRVPDVLGSAANSAADLRSGLVVAAGANPAGMMPTTRPSTAGKTATTRKTSPANVPTTKRATVTTKRSTPTTKRR